MLAKVIRRAPKVLISTRLGREGPIAVQCNTDAPLWSVSTRNAWESLVARRTLIAREHTVGACEQLVVGSQSLTPSLCKWRLPCSESETAKLWCVRLTCTWHKWPIISQGNMSKNNTESELFVLCFLVYWKIEPNSQAFSRIRQHVVYDLISKRSHLKCQKNKMWRHRQQFLRFYYNK